jgi:zinc transport system permease protein
LVLRRFSLIGDGLSHVAFGALAAATVLNLTNKMIITLPVTVLCAVLLLRGGGKAKIKGDAAIAMISVCSLALGYMIMNIFSTASNLSGDVCGTLFGSTSVLTLSEKDVVLCGVLSAITVAVFVFFRNIIFAVTFDEDFAETSGVNTGVFDLAASAIIAGVIVLAMNLVGALLISAFVVFPAVSAMRLFKSFGEVAVCAAVISVICALAGILISVVADTPVGSTIVVADGAAFLLCSCINKISGGA